VTARGNLQKLMPKEIRIVKYLLTIEDPEECLYALQDAFTPGEELEGKDVDNLFTYVSRTQLLLLSCRYLYICSFYESSTTILRIHSTLDDALFFSYYIFTGPPRNFTPG
jgi:hypothetical protein